MEPTAKIKQEKCKENTKKKITKRKSLLIKTKAKQETETIEKGKRKIIRDQKTQTDKKNMQKARRGRDRVKNGPIDEFYWEALQDLRRVFWI